MKTAFNETTAYANKLSYEISDNDAKLDELSKGAGEASTQIEKIGDSSQKTGDKLNKTKSEIEDFKESFNLHEAAEQVSEFAYWYGRKH